MMESVTQQCVEILHCWCEGLLENRSLMRHWTLIFKLIFTPIGTRIFIAKHSEIISASISTFINKTVYTTHPTRGFILRPRLGRQHTTCVHCAPCTHDVMCPACIVHYVVLLGGERAWSPPQHGFLSCGQEEPATEPLCAWLHAWPLPAPQYWRGQRHFRS